MPIEAYSALVRTNGGYIAQAHPYRKLFLGKSQVPIAPHLLDGIEVFNAGRLDNGEENEKALIFARSHNLSMQSGTDSHKPNCPFYSGIKMDRRAESVFNIIDAIKTNKAQLILPNREELLIDREIDEADSMLVKIFYDCHHAKDAAEALCHYIETNMETNALCADSKEEGKIDKMARITKTIILGHHSNTRKRLRHIGVLKFDKFGMKYGSKDNLCVLRASKSELRSSKHDRSRFVVEYCQRFDENPEEKPTRAAQFKFLAMEFISSGLEEFMNS